MTDPKHPFAGIAERLKRADQNIVNLHDEITTFFKKCDYPIIPHPNDKEWQNAVDYHRNLEIPLRFAVLAGEIVHHLRSSLDHLVWIFSSAKARTENSVSIAFPILWRDPPTPKELKRFDRNIQGITDSRVRDIITALQPYHRGGDGIDDPLAIVHEMNRYDKHRELLLVSSGITVSIITSQLSTEATEAISRHGEGKLLSDRQKALIGKAIKQNHNVTPMVAFSKFGRRKTQAVIPSLTQLINAVAKDIELFDVLAVL